jgi:glycosyltransferase involved in cell wall biosynthesis
MGAKHHKISYLLDAFLSPSTTFVTHEVRYLVDHACPLNIFVLSRSAEASIDPANIDLLPLAQFTRPLHLGRMVLCHLSAISAHPCRYVRTLWEIARVTGRNPSQCFRALGHFAEGILVGRKMVDQGISRVHVHFAGRAATAAFTIRRLYGIPYSVTTHAYDLFVDSFDLPGQVDPFDETSPKRETSSLLQLKLLSADKIITISEFNYRLLTERVGIGTEKVQIVRCGVDTARFRPRVQPPAATPAILSIGGLVEKKGHNVLIQACALLDERGLEFTCNIIGTGPLLNQLLSLRDSLRLEHRVRFCGLVHHSEVLRYFEEADVFVLACLRGKNGNMDGIPVALMEAMAMEIPVVATDLSGIPELVESGSSGYLVEPGRPEELAGRIEQLLRDSQLRKTMGRRGRQKVLKDYDQATNLPLVAETLSSRLALQREQGCLL